MYDATHLKNRQARLTIDSIDDKPETEEDLFTHDLCNEKRGKDSQTTRAQPRQRFLFNDLQHQTQKSDRVTQTDNDDLVFGSGNAIDNYDECKHKLVNKIDDLVEPTDFERRNIKKVITASMVHDTNNMRRDPEEEYFRLVSIC